MSIKYQEYQETYQQIQQIGNGSYGDVFKIKQLHSHQYFAIKKIVIKTQTELTQSIQQLVHLYKINNPNIIPIYHWYIRFLTNRGRETELGIIMELGICSIEQVILNKNVQPKWVEILLKDMVTALAKLQLEICSHCDIKPANIIVTNFQKFTCKLVDFGISSKSTSSSEFKGSYAYASPALRIIFHNYKKQKITHDPIKSDVFALGLTLLQMMTFAQIDKLKFQSIQSLDLKGWNQKLVIIIKKMLNLNQKQRPDFIQLQKLIDSEMNPFLKKQQYYQNPFEQTVLLSKQFIQGLQNKTNKTQKFIQKKIYKMSQEYEPIMRGQIHLKQIKREKYQNIRMMHWYQDIGLIISTAEYLYLPSLSIKTNHLSTFIHPNHHFSTVHKIFKINIAQKSIQQNYAIQDCVGISCFDIFQGQFIVGTYDGWIRYKGQNVYKHQKVVRGVKQLGQRIVTAGEQGLISIFNTAFIPISFMIVPFQSISISQSRILLTTHTDIQIISLNTQQNIHKQKVQNFLFNSYYDQNIGIAVGFEKVWICKDLKIGAVQIEGMISGCIKSKNEVCLGSKDQLVTYQII